MPKADFSPELFIDTFIVGLIRKVGCHVKLRRTQTGRTLTITFPSRANQTG